MSSKFVAGWNMPGYLPEMEPAELDTLGEAKDFLLEALGDLIESAYQSNSSQDSINGLRSARSEIRKARIVDIPVNARTEDFVFWIALGE